MRIAIVGADFAGLGQAGMEPCQAVLGVLARPPVLGFTGALVANSPVSWSAVKGAARLG